MVTLVHIQVKKPVSMQNMRVVYTIVVVKSAFVDLMNSSGNILDDQTLIDCLNSSFSVLML